MRDRVLGTLRWSGHRKCRQGTKAYEDRPSGQTVTRQVRFSGPNAFCTKVLCPQALPILAVYENCARATVSNEQQ